MTQPARRQPFALSVLLGAILLSGQAMAAVTDQEILHGPKPGRSSPTVWASKASAIARSIP